MLVNGKLQFDIDICPDCACWYANADSSGVSDIQVFGDALEAFGDAMIAHYPNGWDIIVGDGEAFFSHSRCEVCDALPGDRITSTFVEL